MDDIQFKKSYSAFINPNYNVTPAKSNQTPKTNPADSEFGKIFQNAIEQKQQLTFSKHALQRMDSRNIPVSGQLLSQINSAVTKARAKGIKDALILSGQTAFIVNIPSSTVVTTMNGQELTDNIFTNIDGAVII
ncbi:flagellar operon protein [Caproiciproducens galactitolivorans]|uniref:Flagellar operon protein n=1 Tax=Caproiciproducens galactitolivorans TaxID=642589 RepID=A0A4Z0Y2F1_9FIRM|nr:TIGR02530 family flagellar biosynthesis protein [Caproiciproducens galactitolivorans]QEY34339.1 flagellar operon protein [Caproiciproducens galactitolivorans]TGJ77894.1 hypothetical protein CAGA_03030 [Caproiciproducens galactitolivorans]